VFWSWLVLTAQAGRKHFRRDDAPLCPSLINHYGSGLEADQKVIAAHGCYAMTATTALTAQNTLGVRDIHEVPPEFVRKQIDACVEDIGVDVLKSGALSPHQIDRA
jgi:hydroxymethylpyrimidine/phosphomethylpyrimidine kinase